MIRWLLRIGLMSLLGIVALAAITEYRFGSLAVARAYYRGKPLEVVEPLGMYRYHSDRRISFVLLVRSNSPYPINLVGASATCGCMQIDGLPITLPALGYGLLSASSTAGLVQATLYADTGPVMMEISVAPDEVTVRGS